MHRIRDSPCLLYTSYERNRLFYAGAACRGSAANPFGQPCTPLGNASTGTFFVARLSGQPVSVSMPPTISLFRYSSREIRSFTSSSSAL